MLRSIFETILKKLSYLIVFFLLFSMTNLQLCFKHASEQILVEVCCLKYQKPFKTMIRSRFQGMFLNSFQRTVGGGDECSLFRRPCHKMRCAKFTKSPHVQPPEPNHPSSITLAGPLPNTSRRKKTYQVESF